MKFRSFLLVCAAMLLAVGLTATAHSIPGPASMTMGVGIPKSAPILPTPVEPAAPPVFKFSEVNPRDWLQLTYNWQAQHKPRQITNWFIVNYQNSTWRVDWDAERRPFIGFVIHHSAGNPLLMVDSLSTIGKERVYEPRYTKPWAQSYGDPLVWGLPVHSGHRLAGQEETFATYHYYIYPEGDIIQALETLIELKGQWYIDMVAWHGGNWEVNCETLAICLMGDFTSSEPTLAQIESMNRIIDAYLTVNPKLTVKGHKEVGRDTICPGNSWDSWRQKLIR